MAAPTTSIASGVDRGFEFAERVYELAHEHGPSDWAAADKEALGSHLVDAAINFVAARNVASRVEA